MECIAIATMMIHHGKWTYKTVVLYESGIRRSDGTDVWVKKYVLHKATTQAKIERLAKAEAEARGIPLLPYVRHYTPITPIAK